MQFPFARCHLAVLSLSSCGQFTFTVWPVGGLLWFTMIIWVALRPCCSKVGHNVYGKLAEIVLKGGFVGEM